MRIDIPICIGKNDIVRQYTTSQLPAHQNSLMADRAIPLSACRLGPPAATEPGSETV
jgi:hypothetical protein